MAQISPVHAIVRRFRDTVISHDLVHKGDRIVVGCSGGPDSVALLRLLHELNLREELQLNLIAAHLHHGLRGEEADEDEQFVRTLADQLNAHFVSERVDLDQQRDEENAHGGVEEAGRMMRLRFLQRVCYLHGSSKVFLGHHADDNAETILHRIVRGTGLRGLSGIPMQRELFVGSDVAVIRPMLEFTRAELLEFLTGCDQPYRLDSTNQQSLYTRNRLRHEVFPLLEQSINPRVRHALLRLSEQASLAHAYLMDTATRIFETLVIDRTDALVSLNKAALCKKSPSVQAEVIEQAIINFGLGEQETSYEHIRAVQRMATHNTGKMDLPGGLRVVVEYNNLVFLLSNKPSHLPLVGESPLEIPGELHIPAIRLRVKATFKRGDASSLTEFRKRRTKLEEWIDPSKLHGPFIVRSRRPGDRFWPLGAPGNKKLADFLSDCQVESWYRDRVPILCDARGPIWVIPYRIDDRVKITTGTQQVVHLTADFHLPGDSGLM